MQAITQFLGSLGPLQAVALGTGVLFMIVSFGAMAYLTAGAVVDLLIPEPSGPGPSRADR